MNYAHIALLLCALSSSLLCHAQSEANDSTSNIVCTISTAKTRYTKLTDQDYQKVANELGIEVAIIKAVSDIEAGKNHAGFVEPGKPTLNYSTNLFNNYLRKRNIKVAASTRAKAPAFQSLNRNKYGSYGLAQHARLESAMSIDSISAIYSCYWGMFQISGTNWKRCECSSPQEFAQLMCHSELMQLELFARFISSGSGKMLTYLKNKNWYGFARIYNGSKRAKSYANRMATAYRKYKK